MNTFQTDTVQDGLVPNDPYRAFVYLQARGIEILLEIFGYPAQELADEGMTLDTAQARGLSLDQLLMIDRHAQSLHIQDAAWILRAELTAYDGCYDEMDAYSFERVESLGGIKTKGGCERLQLPIRDGVLPS